MDAQDLMWMRLLGGGLSGGSGWLQVVFLAFLLAVPVFRPERIRNVSLFRKAYILFALSIIIPNSLSIFISGLATPGRFGTGGSDGVLQALAQTGLLQMLAASGPALFGISMICGLGAVVSSFIPPPGYGPSKRRSEEPSLSGGDDFPGDGVAVESNAP